MDQKQPPPTPLDTARRLGRELLAEVEAVPPPEPLHWPHMAGRLEVALRTLLDALDAQDGGESQ